MADSIHQLRERIRQFAIDRDWLQFHNPKNLSMALTVEAGELMEVYQWKTSEESWKLHENQEQFDHVKGEMADIFIYLTHLANILDVDLIDAVNKKMDVNDIRFPASEKLSTTSFKK